MWIEDDMLAVLLWSSIAEGDIGIDLSYLDD